MAGQPLKVESLFIPPPLDGLNLVSAPTELKPTEARTLDNYLVFDTGIREVPVPTRVYNGTGVIGFQFPYYDTSNVEKVFFSLGTSLYRYNVAAATVTDITGGSAIVSALWFPCYFNKNIFIFNGDSVPRIHNLGSGAVADTAFTGVTQTTLVQATGYKSRIYITQVDSTSVWYGGVGSTSGALTEYNFGQILEYPGRLLCCFNWTYNQGNSNDELFVALTEQGEFLIYSGDYPAASNWQLIAKGRMPAVTTIQARQPFIKVSNDVYICTNRGVVAFSSFVAGAENSSYFNLSRNIKLSIAAGRAPALDNVNPFAYFVGTNDNQMSSIYVLNYERQAWSRLYFPGGLDGSFIRSISAFNGVIRIGTQDGDLYELDIADATDSNTTHTWQTPFMNFGRNTEKSSKLIRVVGLNYGNSGNFKNTVSISTNFVDPASPTTDSASTAVSADTNTVQELAPPGTGRWLSYKFSRAGTSAENQKNEIQGFEVFFETGGAY